MRLCVPEEVFSAALKHKHPLRKIGRQRRPQQHHSRYSGHWMLSNSIGHASVFNTSCQEKEPFPLGYAPDSKAQKASCPMTCMLGHLTSRRHVMCSESTLTNVPSWLQASENGAGGLPSGDLVYKAPSGMQKFATSLRLIRALPWRRFKKGSVLVIEVIANP